MLDLGFESATVDGAVEHEGGDKASQGQRASERCGVPKAVRHSDPVPFAECGDRARALAAQPGVHYVSLPHMMQAQWDVLELIIEPYARDFPEAFPLRKQGARWT